MGLQPMIQVATVRLAFTLPDQIGAVADRSFVYFHTCFAPFPNVPKSLQVKMTAATASQKTQHATPFKRPCVPTANHRFVRRSPLRLYLRCRAVRHRAGHDREPLRGAAQPDTMLVVPGMDPMQGTEPGRYAH